MTENSEILFCEKCGRRESFVVSGSGQKGICLKCGIEVLDLPDARVKAVMDFTFDTLSNVVDE